MAEDRMPGAALVRQVYERAVAEAGPRLAELTASEGFAEAVELATAAQARLQREIERRSRRFLHFWNLPAGSDVTVLRREIGELERQVRDLTKRLEDADRMRPAPKAAKAAKADGGGAPKRAAPTKRARSAGS